MSESLTPLSLFRLDCPEPPAGWDRLLESENVELVEDDVGRACIGRGDARRLLGALRAETASVRMSGVDATTNRPAAMPSSLH